MLANFDLVPTKAARIKTEDRFGSLVVLAVGQISGTYKYFAICQCDCGSQIRRIRFDHLTSGSTGSCGCEQLRRVTTHGLSGSEHYGRWQNMMSRCYDEKCKAYPNYGGRGIKVFDGWHDVARYIADLPAGHFKGAEIDRIDNDGDYVPGNIRWATPSQNAGNRRSGRIITHNGKSQSQRQWAQELGITDRAIQSRIDVLGWTVDKALTTPMIANNEVVKIASSVRWAGHDTKGKPPPKTERKLRTVEVDGRSTTLAELSEITGIPTKTLGKRIFERGWSVERAMQQ